MSQQQNEKQNEPDTPHTVTPGSATDVPVTTEPANTESSGTSEKTDFKSYLLKFWKAFNEFLNEQDDVFVEPEPAPEKPFKETVRDFLDRWHDPKQRVEMRKEFGERVWTLFFHGMVYFFLFVLTIFFTIKALDYSENHRVKFFPPDEIVEYLTKEHEALEARALPLTTMIGKLEDIPFDKFDPQTIEMVKPLKIYSDEYAVYFMTNKDWYNGEHGIFIVRDEDNMPPDLNWGLIEGKIYTYAIYD